MFPLIDIQKNYHFPDEKWVFDKLNNLTYDKYWKVMEGEFSHIDPPTFELWYTGDLPRSGKPMSTKLTVSPHSVGAGVDVKVNARANITLYIMFFIMLIGLTYQLFRNFRLPNILPAMIILVGIVVLDRWAKRRAYAKLEEILS